MPRNHRDAERRLFEIAEGQQGFFTAKQAKAAGFAENTHPYHVQVETGFANIVGSTGSPSFRRRNIQTW